MVKQLTNSSTLLSTHRMDEAEQLCDNIAIMINGRFVCYGSPSYLKKQYGHGYTLTIRQTKAMMRQLFVPEIIRREIPNAVLTMQGVAKENLDHFEYAFNVVGIESKVPSKRLSSVFAKLAQILSSGNVIDFTLTRTTLE